MSSGVAKKEWQPGMVLLGMAFFIGVGLIMVMSVVFLIPGVALIAYGVVFAATEALEHAWNALERFAAWFFNRDT